MSERQLYVRSYVAHQNRNTHRIACRQADRQTDTHTHVHTRAPAKRDATNWERNSESNMKPMAACSQSTELRTRFQNKVQNGKCIGGWKNGQKTARTSEQDTQLIAEMYIRRCAIKGIKTYTASICTYLYVDDVFHISYLKSSKEEMSWCGAYHTFFYWCRVHTLHSIGFY